MNLLVDFVLRHPWAGWLLGAATDFGLWVRPYLAVALWVLGALFAVLAVGAAVTGWWPGAGVCTGFVALCGVLLVGMNRAARRLEAVEAELHEELGR